MSASINSIFANVRRHAPKGKECQQRYFTIESIYSRELFIRVNEKSPHCLVVEISSGRLCEEPACFLKNRNLYLGKPTREEDKPL